MKKLQNVLYVLTPESYLFCQNEAIAVRIGGEEKARIPSHTIESILCFGNTTVSTPFIRFCGERNIGLTFLSEYGRFYGRVYGPVSGNVLLRKKQYDALNQNELSSQIVKSILFGKFANCRMVLMKAAREHADINSKESLNAAAEKIASSAKLLDSVNDINTMRGLEGTVASDYFAVFDNMIRTPDTNMFFERRSRRPPENEVNALLSFLYMLLKNDIQSALECIGLDPAAGFLHTLRSGRPSLALDLMEELRSPLCDRIALSLINLKQIKTDDFENNNGQYILLDKARRVVIDQWQKRKKEVIFHSFFEQKIAIGLIPYAQSQLFARVIRGDLDEYPAFYWR
ncbi:MAG: type I-C CRISPR-associated endonuclease Cas1 [Clostridiaceae bacterium]|nr:type I-C CRISPR-associated endonuclease Cas1 [Clostridiaceae bacterium]